MFFNRLYVMGRLIDKNILFLYDTNIQRKMQMKFNFAPDYQHRILWYFFAFALGCATYFGISFEPNLWMLLACGIIMGALFIWRRWISIGILFFILLGMSVASIRTHMVTTPMLDHPLWRQTISGFVVDKVDQPDRQEIVLDRVWSKKNVAPSKVRLTLYKTEPSIQLGDWIRVQSHLFPAGDVFAQRMFFQGIGARGKVLRVFEIRPRQASLIDRVRVGIIDRIKAVLPYSSAQIAIPLVTGEQRVVSQEMYDIYRKAGIAHILSVSGFHMALLAGFIFFFIRGLLCLIPYIALHVNTKKIAAAVALGITFLYLLLSGVQIPALRSFLMISVVLIAVLLDRRAFSLYTLLLVGFGMLCVRPEWIMSISFQFSFVAMMGLVSLFSQANHQLKNHRVMHFIWSLVGANILIEFLLMPYVMYHFNQINLYGVVGNLAVSLLFSFCVMPLLFLGCLFMPFGWDIPFLKGAGWI
jgi:competence protein ComEC